MREKIQMKNRKLRRIMEGGVERSVVNGINWEEINERRCNVGAKQKVSG